MPIDLIGSSRVNAAAVDFVALLFEHFRDIGARDRPENLVLFARPHFDFYGEGLKLLGHFHERGALLLFPPGDDALLVFNLFGRSGIRLYGQLARQQEIPRVPIGDLHSRAHLAEVRHVFTQDNLHGVASF